MTLTTVTPLRPDERGVATYTFDQPATRNALSLATLQHVDATLAGLDDDPSVRVIVFTGAGSAFSSGADRSELGGPGIVARTTELMGSIMARLDACPVPVVCRVNGPAFGAGLAIVAAADISIAAAGSVFGFPEVRFGLVAGPAMAAAVRRIGETAALDLFLTGRRFSAEDAARSGLVAAVVAPEELDAAVDARVDELLQGDREAVATTKRLVRQLSPSSMADAVALATRGANDLNAAPVRSPAGTWARPLDVDWRDVPAQVRRQPAAAGVHPELRRDVRDLGRCVVTMGTYDGMHRGHAEVIARTVEIARKAGLPSLLLTFDPHPAEVVRPGSHPAVLTTLARRAELATALGIDFVRVLQFDLGVSQLDAGDFVHETMVERLRAAEVVVGSNFRFGYRAAGSVASLGELAQRFGFALTDVPLVSDDGTILSSTYLRSCIGAGDVALAARSLGRPHRIDGLVEHGDHRGRQLGYPTANLSVDRFTAVPADGVYAGRVVQLDEWGQTGEPLGRAAISVGTNPTFDGQQRRVEAYILDFDGDLYGRALGFEFTRRLRGMARFDGVDALVRQMELDVAEAREDA